MSSYGDNTYGETHVTTVKETTQFNVKKKSVSTFSAKAGATAAESTVGFYGATPANQHVAITTPAEGAAATAALNQAAIADILVALRSYGLVAASEGV